MPRSCPKCAQPLEQPPCPMCAWQPEPPTVVTYLFANGQVVTLTWVEEAGARVGMTVGVKSLWEWLRRRVS